MASKEVFGVEICKHVDDLVVDLVIRECDYMRRTQTNEVVKHERRNYKSTP